VRIENKTFAQPLQGLARHLDFGKEAKERGQFLPNGFIIILMAT